MKKLILIGATVGIASLAQAGNFVSGGTIVTSGTVLSGGNDYIYQETVAAGTVINGATITFNNINLTQPSNVGIDNVLYYDVVTATQAHAITQNGVPEANYLAGQDYFTVNNLGKQIGSSLPNANNTTSDSSNPTGWGSNSGYNKSNTPKGYFPVGVTETWSTTITGAALTLLESEFLTGTFDIGFDPNCPYNIGSITLSWTTPNVQTAPDNSATVILLGLSFAGLLAFRRKLCLN